MTGSAILITRKSILTNFGGFDISVSVTARNDVHFLAKRRDIKTVKDVF